MLSNKKTVSIFLLVILALSLFAMAQQIQNIKFEDNKTQIIAGRIHYYNNRYIIKEPGENGQCHFLLENEALQKFLSKINLWQDYVITGRVFKFNSATYILPSKFATLDQDEQPMGKKISKAGRKSSKTSKKNINKQRRTNKKRSYQKANHKRAYKNLFVTKYNKNNKTGAKKSANKNNKTGAKKSASKSNAKSRTHKKAKFTQSHKKPENMTSMFKRNSKGQFLSTKSSKSKSKKSATAKSGAKSESKKSATAKSGAKSKSKKSATAKSGAKSKSKKSVTAKSGAKSKSKKRSYKNKNKRKSPKVNQEVMYDKWIEEQIENAIQQAM